MGIRRTGGTDSTFWWGGDLGTRQANCAECKTGEASRTMPVGSFKANAFGLFDTAGNAAEWVEDCWNDNYRGAPVNAWPGQHGQCNMRVLRGGAFDSQSRYLRSASRFRYDSMCDIPPTDFESCGSWNSAAIDGWAEISGSRK
jgi:formylglycine-generating enzyme required for sulfatase activity